MNPGQIVISAVIKANALESAMLTENGAFLFVWSANADEQIEAALADMGFELKELDVEN